MKYSFAIGIPTLNRSDLLNPTLVKYFKQFPDVEIFIVNNGDKKIKSRNSKFHIHESPKNYGVAKSWNYLCDWIFESHEYAFILNDDIELSICQNEISNLLPTFAYFDLLRCEKQFHMSSFCLTKSTFSKFRFDETFGQAYFEDVDYLARLKKENKVIKFSKHINPTNFKSQSTLGNQVLPIYFSSKSKFMEKWNLKNQEFNQFIEHQVS